MSGPAEGVRAARRVLKKLARGFRHVTRWPPVRTVDMGDLARTSPISRNWGFDRGTPIDRYYIEQFMQDHANDVRGHVLEFLNDGYTVRYGGDRVERSDVLHHEPGNPRATIVGDLTVPDSVPSGAYDCVICTQTIQFIFDVQTAVTTLHRALRPGGTLLLTVPAITHISRADMDGSGEYWRFTGVAVERLIGEVFTDGTVEVVTYGNVASAVALLHGIASEELDPRQVETADPDYEVIVAVRATKGRTAP